MRMPNARQISEEQQDIFEDAPITGNILVSGPPGTGKTVIAFLRAQALASKNIPAVVLMYNRVLRKYTENVAREIDGNVTSKTLHSWLTQWWKKHEIPKDLDNKQIQNDKSSNVYLNSPYSDKDDVKAAGGYWDNELKHWYVTRTTFKKTPEKFTRWPEYVPMEQAKNIDKVYLYSNYEERNQVKRTGAKWDHAKNKWFITKEQLNTDFENFQKWLTDFSPLELGEWQFDWERMLDQYLELEEEKQIDWGHLIIDEAQDFPPEMFKFLRAAGRCLENGGMTILADENQRLFEGKNASLEEIRQNLKIKETQEFRLTQNFRNTLPIALLARHFYVGLATGTPELPERNGSKPKLIATNTQEKQLEYIQNFLQMRGAQEVAIVVDNDQDRVFYLNNLKMALPNYKVQHYSSADPSTSEYLDFDEQGVITVLNRRSCKGLEFDTVFIPDLQNFSFSDTELTNFKMNMYVLCSRARSELVLIYRENPLQQARILELLPNKESGLMDYQQI